MIKTEATIAFDNMFVLNNIKIINQNKLEGKNRFLNVPYEIYPLMY